MRTLARLPQIALFLFAAFAATASERFVAPADLGGSDANPGTDDEPYATIQYAIDQATPGDIINLAAGTYTGVGNRDINLGDKELTIAGPVIAAGDPPTATVDCETLGRGITVNGQQSRSTLITRLEIRNGRIEAAQGIGGGMVINGASPTIHRVFIDACTAIGIEATDNTDATSGQGGGLFIGGGSPLIDDCAFTGCTAIGGNSSDTRDPRDGLGGGAYVSYSTPVFQGCGFFNNVCIGGETVLLNGPAGGAFGGGLFVDASGFDPDIYGQSITNCFFGGNSCTGGVGPVNPGSTASGALHFVDYCDGLVSRTTFYSNNTEPGGTSSAVHVGADANIGFIDCLFLNNFGNESIVSPTGAVSVTAQYGGVPNRPGLTSFQRCLWAGNNDSGAALYGYYGPNLYVDNCTFSGNTSLLYSAGILATTVTETGAMTLRNSTFVGNTSGPGEGTVSNGFSPAFDIAMSNCAFQGNGPLAVAGLVTSDGGNVCDDATILPAALDDKPSTAPGLDPVLAVNFGTLPGTALAPWHNLLYEVTAAGYARIPTHAPLPGAAVIDAANAIFAETDARGVARPYGPAADSGAVELVPGYFFADFDDTGCVELNDFLFLLDNWQTDVNIGGTMVTIDLTVFLNLVDNWRLGPLCE